MTYQFDIFDNGSASQPGERQTDLEELIAEKEAFDMNTGINKDGTLKPQTIQTKLRGTNDQEYQIYLDGADDGKGGDITRNGAPLKTYDEWLNS